MQVQYVYHCCLCLIFGIIYAQLLQEGGKDLSNDAQIRVIRQMEPEICTKNAQMLSEKLGAKFPATTLGCSIVKIARLDDAFLEVF